jgi:hypothetical protein
MLLNCPRVQVLFPQEKIRLEHQGPARMLWAEHGGTLILKVGDLKFSETAASGEESGLFLEVDLTPGEDLIHKIEDFAVKHSLALGHPPEGPASAFTAHPFLAACHLPDKKIFVFAEESQLQARPSGRGTVEMAVRGAFRVRAVPSQEADLVIHLYPGDLAGLLSYLRALARAGG